MHVCVVIIVLMSLYPYYCLWLSSLPPTFFTVCLSVFLCLVVSGIESILLVNDSLKSVLQSPPLSACGGRGQGETE